MKKKILMALVTVVLLFSVVLTGCGGGVSQADYDSLTALLSDAEARLTVAQNNLDALQSQKDAVDSDLAVAETLVADLQAQVADLQQQLTEYIAMYDFTGLTNAEIAEKIVENYKDTHLYEEDVYDCNNMASDVWNMLKAQGIDAVIVVGDIDVQITNILDSDHAWVLAEVAPGEYLALETTAGYVVPKSKNPLYYRGWSFDTPRELKRHNELVKEYNLRVGIHNDIVDEANAVLDEYNQATDQTTADKLEAIYKKLTELVEAQEAEVNKIATEIDGLATELR